MIGVVTFIGYYTGNCYNSFKKYIPKDEKPITSID